jgi:DNA repair protein RecO (recombination protein O)
LTEAKLERRFRSSSRDLSRLYAGYYVAELLYDLTDSGDPHPELYQAAERALFDLDHSGAIASVVVRFELTMLRLLGLLPSLDACVACGAPAAAEGRVSFGQGAGGVLCARCRPGHRQVVSVSAEGLKALQQYASPGGNAWRDLESDSRVRGEMRGLLNQYLANQLGRRPRMHKYLGMLAH